jgi:hypothetical protein
LWASWESVGIDDPDEIESISTRWDPITARHWLDVLRLETASLSVADGWRQEFEHDPHEARLWMDMNLTPSAARRLFDEGIEARTSLRWVKLGSPSEVDELRQQESQWSVGEAERWCRSLDLNLSDALLWRQLADGNLESAMLWRRDGASYQDLVDFFDSGLSSDHAGRWLLLPPADRSEFAEWLTSAVPPDDVPGWIRVGQGREWALLLHEAGVRVQDAHRLVALGFDADAVNASNVLAPVDAVRWGTALGLSLEAVEVLAPLLEHDLELAVKWADLCGADSAGLLQQWRRRLDPAECVAWRSTGISSTEELSPWLKLSWTPGQAAPWREVGASPELALAATRVDMSIDDYTELLHQHGHNTVREAVRWLQEDRADHENEGEDRVRVSPKDVPGWIGLGQGREWVLLLCEAGVGVDEAGRLVALGFTAEALTSTAMSSLAAVRWGARLGLPLGTVEVLASLLNLDLDLGVRWAELCGPEMVELLEHWRDRLDPAECIAWRVVGVDSTDELESWLELGWGPEQTGPWRETGASPEIANSATRVDMSIDDYTDILQQHGLDAVYTEIRHRGLIPYGLRVVDKSLVLDITELRDFEALTTSLGRACEASHQVGVGEFILQDGAPMLTVAMAKALPGARYVRGEMRAKLLIVGLDPPPSQLQQMSVPRNTGFITMLVKPNTFPSLIAQVA